MIEETEAVRWARENREIMNNMSREEKNKYFELGKRMINGEISLTSDGSMVELKKI